MTDIRVGRFSIPEGDLQWTFSPSGGPGGQHANRSNTRAELRFDLTSSESFPDSVRSMLLEGLGTRVVNGSVVVIVDESRSQFRNRAIARQRLAELLNEASKPETPRRPTRPTRASRVRRIESKRRRSEKKRLRQSPDQP